MSQLDAIKKLQKLLIKGGGQLEFDHVGPETLDGRAWWAFRRGGRLVGVLTPSERPGRRLGLVPAGHIQTVVDDHELKLPMFTLLASPLYQAVAPIVDSTCKVGFQLFQEIDRIRKEHDLVEVPIKAGGETFRAQNVRKITPFRYAILDQHGKAVAHGRHIDHGVCWKQMGGPMKGIVARETANAIKQSWLPTLQGGRAVVLPLKPELARTAVWGERSFNGAPDPERMDWASDGNLMLQLVGKTPLLFELGSAAGTRTWFRPEIPTADMAPVFEVKLKTIPPEEEGMEPTYVIQIIPTAMPAREAMR